MNPKSALLLALTGIAIGAPVHASDTMSADAARNAVTAAAPEGVQILDVTLVDQQVHVLGKASDLMKIAAFMREVDASDDFSDADLEFSRTVKSGGAAFSLIATTN